MFDIAPSELMLVAVVALVVIGPKDLPKAMRVVGQWVGRARGMARHFRSGIDEIIRQSELDEMQKKWADENARIMAEHPSPPPEEADDAHFAYPDLAPVMTALPAPASEAVSEHAPEAEAEAEASADSGAHPAVAPAHPDAPANPDAPALPDHRP